MRDSSIGTENNLKWWQIYKASNVYFVLALILLLFGCLIIRSEITLSCYYRQSVGKVVGNYHSYLSKNVMRNARVRYLNTIEYSVDGLTYRFNSNSTQFGVSPTVFSVGQIVDVCYNPDYPERAVLKNRVTDAIAIGIALILIITGFSLIAALFRRYRNMLEDAKKSKR